MVKVKRCFKCGEVKPLSQFYTHNRMADGHVNKCKECNKIDVRINRSNNLEYYRKYDRLRGNRQTEEYRKSYKHKNKIKVFAGYVVNNAVRDGKLEKPDTCESCGNKPKMLHGHHDDYAFPLVVRWLCPGCHSRWHKENGEGKNG